MINHESFSSFVSPLFFHPFHVISLFQLFPFFSLNSINFFPLFHKRNGNTHKFNLRNLLLSLFFFVQCDVSKRSACVYHQVATTNEGFQHPFKGLVLVLTMRVSTMLKLLVNAQVSKTLQCFQDWLFFPSVTDVTVDINEWVYCWFYLEMIWKSQTLIMRNFDAPRR